MKSQQLFVFNIFIQILNRYALSQVNLIGRHGCYAKSGDINLGISMIIHESGQGDEICGQRLSARFFLEVVFSMGLTFDKINQDSSILPNITLGFIVLDDCGKDTAALARAMAFTSSNHKCNKLNDENKQDGITYSKCCEALNNNSVKGVIGPFSSRQNIMAASLLSLYGIPTLAPVASSEELDDKSRFGYFLRLFPADRFQAEAMLAFYTYQNWSYSALIYSEGGYGENGAKLINNEAKKRGICLAFTFMLPSRPVESDFEYIRRLLDMNPEAVVITLFLEQDVVETFFIQMKNFEIFHNFIWFGSETVILLDKNKFEGILSLSVPQSNEIPEFNEALKQ